MVVGDDQVVDVRHVDRLVNVRTLEHLVRKTNRRALVKYRIHEKLFPGQVQQIGRMPEPNKPIPVGRERFDIRLDRTKGGVRDGVLFIVEHELAPDGERALVARHEFRLFFVHELLFLNVVMRRLLDAFQALALRNLPKTRLAHEQHARVSKNKKDSKDNRGNHEIKIEKNEKKAP